MKQIIIIILTLLTLAYSCSNPDEGKQKEWSGSKEVSIHVDTALTPIERDFKSVPEKIKPVFGYRFIISGDFNGDGKTEELIEHYISGLDNKETNKFYEGLIDDEQLVALTVEKKAISFISCDKDLIDTLHISSGGQLLGLSYLKNEGDLNNDGTDEISYVVNWADWSSINTCYLMTYRNGKWESFYTFGIWDWQLPRLPEVIHQYGLFGPENKTVDLSNNTSNQRIEKKLNNFEGFIKKVNKTQIQVRFRNDDAMEDTVIIELKRLSKKARLAT